MQNTTKKKNGKKKTIIEESHDAYTCERETERVGEAGSQDTRVSAVPDHAE